MERLEIKKINGNDYYYYSKWGRKDGKCRRLWQKYLGTAKTIIEMFKTKESEHQKVLYADVFQFGLPTALWNESFKASVVIKVDKCCKKRGRKLSVGHYIALAAINRAADPVSKSGMWEWFSKTSLMRLFPNITEKDLSSQQFWNKMEQISPEDCKTIWHEIINDVISNEKVDLSSILYDGTNYYTFIDTFNGRSSLAKRGKNKQGRANLRQINYALFCTADNYIPLLYDIYEGNENDYTHFPLALHRLQSFINAMGTNKNIKENTTVVFDKGNCSKKNFVDIDASQLYYITSTKLDEHPELTTVSNQDSRFMECSVDLDRTKSFKVKKIIHNKERIVVVTYNANLFECQWKTLQNDIEKAVKHLSELRQKLEDRENGLIVKGRAPAKASIETQCKEILSREYLKEIINYSITNSKKESLPKLEYSIDQEAYRKISDTYLGKNILISNREKWSNDDIIRGYRSQYMIEEIFKESKDRKFGTWWPLHHWTDSKIHVHALYCTIALLLRALMKRRVEQSGKKISMRRLLTELSEIKEVVNIYDANGKTRSETILSRLSETQEALSDILKLFLDKNP